LVHCIPYEEALRMVYFEWIEGAVNGILARAASPESDITRGAVSAKH
jgi:hypothetical protein